MEVQEKVAKAIRLVYIEKHQGRTPGNYTPWALLPTHRREKWMDMAEVAIDVLAADNG
jgi:hypothetical protein